MSAAINEALADYFTKAQIVGMFAALDCEVSPATIGTRPAETVLTCTITGKP